ncbi:coiled-coil domain-containing protein 113 [Polypterus senegalus]|uniref:coiled-coil domain-containing protein 113 n=1 Tax=Polypterus senegalus TaxID=55291 RepID=UPI00196578A5|nr:coiled-coil domain-containing protein 113 [Polypterus senegalus]
MALVEAASVQLSELSDHQLAELVRSVSQSNAALQTETEMFQKFVSRLDPKEFSQVTVSKTTTSGIAQHELGQVSRQERLVLLTMEQKCLVAQREEEELRKALEQLRKESERVVNTYKAAIEEADYRQGEVKKALCEFQRDFGKRGHEKKRRILGTEKVTRYIEEKSKAKDKIVEKLRLENTALKVKMRKLQMQLKQKEEMDEALHEVDFQLLKIENSQYLQKIDESKQELLRLKLMDRNKLQILDTYKKKLQNLTSESKRLTGELAAKKDLLVRVEAEIVQAEKECAKAEAQNKRLKTQLSDYRGPRALDYVAIKARHSELQRDVHVWERKVDIAQMDLKRNTKAYTQLTRASQPAPGP